MSATDTLAKQKQETIQEPEPQRPSSEVMETMQEGREELMGILTESVDGTVIKDYTDPIGRSPHSHAPNKHDVRKAFNVNPNLIRNEFDLSFIPNGHEVLWYMMENKDKLIESDTPVFTDTHDHDVTRWDEIEGTRKIAPIKPECEARIKAES